MIVNVCVFFILNFSLGVLFFRFYFSGDLFTFYFFISA